jgi:hypothetical protein
VRFSYVLFIAVIFVMNGCSCNRKGGRNMNQGEIHYNIEYIGNFSFPTEALPRDLVFSFKEDKILFEMLGFGNSGITNLANPDLGIYDTYYNFLGVKKYYYSGEEGELFPGFEAMRGMKLKKTSKTSLICGYKCRNAQVSFNWQPGKIYEIWYTDELNVEEPNASTPFNEIKGVLMNFFFIINSVEFHFDAEAVYEKELSEDVFERKENYTRVSKENIREFMKGMLEFQR